MRTGYAFLAALSLSHVLCANAWYYLEDEWVGDAFFNGDWAWETENDPTHGRVNYVSQADAVKDHLSYGNVFPATLSTPSRFDQRRLFSARQPIHYARGRCVLRR